MKRTENLDYQIDGIESPEQWVAENELPPGSKAGVDELLIWVAEIDEAALALPPESEQHLQLQSKRDLIMHILRCAFADEDGGRSARPDYFKIGLKAIKDKRARERA